MADGRLGEIVEQVAAGSGPVVVLTGAGVSAESGIPTFRGPEGYWRVGSRHYRPMELATRAAFDAMPDDVWAWYLHRRAVCHAAAPNGAHLALARLERALGDRLLLVTQNVDGLHLRAGSSSARTYQIHGNLDLMRCAAGCSRDLVAVPEPAEPQRLACPRCGGHARPHVLWFDECYDEGWFRFESALGAAARADLLIVVGTSGATTLPARMCETVAGRGAPMIVVDPEPTPFTRLAESSPRGLVLTGTACAVVPPLAAALAARLART